MKELEHIKDFWAREAQKLTWLEPFKNVLDYSFEEKPFIKWFYDGKLNACYNCVDRHVKSKGDKPAIIFEPNNPGDEARTLTYAELHTEVCKFSNFLLTLNVKKGDRVCVYMPMIPEAVIAVLALGRIGAIAMVVFAGFSSNALLERVNNAKAEIIITADLLFRGEKVLNLMENIEGESTLSKVVCFQRGKEVPKTKLQLYIWQDEIIKFSPESKPEAMNAEDELFILYTSGSTGKPKGVVHSTGGYLTSAAYSFKNVFNYQEGDVHFCTADIGWITGHTYLIYGPLLNGATIVMFEGVPTFPTPSRYWEVIERHNVNIFYTSPTAIRMLMQKGEAYVQNFNMHSLKVLGSVGEPINLSAFEWFYKNVGKKRCEIMDTWWQTETGSILISSLCSQTVSKPGFAGMPLPCIDARLLNAEGVEVQDAGNLCFKFPWPGMLRGIWGDEGKFKQTYFSKFKGYYFSGDGALKEGDLFKITGRVDDVMNVSGHRFGTAEIENIVNLHANIAESAVTSFPHEVKGEGIVVFGIYKNSNLEGVEQEINDLISKQIGLIAKPDKIFLVKDLPKTRSGKIMRRILKQMIAGSSEYGDISTLINPESIRELELKIAS